MGRIVCPRMGNAMDSASLLACLLWPLWHARSVPSVMPARPLPSFPLAPFCHPAGPLLSFPPVVSGNPESFSSVPSFGWSCMGKAMDSRLKMSGMTEGD